jgi:hypothetical protein
MRTLLGFGADLNHRSAKGESVWSVAEATAGEEGSGVVQGEHTAVLDLLRLVNGPCESIVLDLETRRVARKDARLATEKQQQRQRLARLAVSAATFSPTKLATA